jgi:hypothetical protein
LFSIAMNSEARIGCLDCKIGIVSRLAKRIEVKAGHGGLDCDSAADVIDSGQPWRNFTLKRVLLISCERWLWAFAPDAIKQTPEGIGFTSVQT